MSAFCIKKLAKNNNIKFKWKQEDLNPWPCVMTKWTPPNPIKKKQIP